jgi:IS605 OrfB family transposase
MSEAAEQIYPKPQLLTRTIRCEIIKPLGDCEWDQLGVVLRTQRTVMGQLVQAGVDTIVACEMVGSEAVKRVIAPEARAEKPSGLAYQGILRELERIRESKSWSDEQQAALQIAGSTLATLSSRAFSDYQAWKTAQYAKRKRGHGKKGRASYGRMQPIALPKVSWTIESDAHKRVSLALKLVSQGTIRVAIAPTHGWHWQTIQRLVKAEIDRHDCKILYSERDKKWFALLSVSEPMPPPPERCDPKNVLVLHRGKHHFLTAFSSTGKWKYTYGRKLVEAKRRFKARREDIKSISRAERGAGANGHGSKRRYELPDALAVKEANWIKTFIQQTAAYAAALAKQWGCGTIVIEEYGGQEPDDDRDNRRFVGRFPWDALKQSIEWSLKKSGLELQQVPSEYISSICPRCGNTDTRQHNQRTGIFHCSKCDYDREADFVAPYHMLRRFLGHAGEHERRMKMEQNLGQQIEQPSQTAARSRAEKGKGKKPGKLK